ncbi:hypothetical protein H0H87_003963, partial [Tephrocybe sp. NHM501043]
MVKEQETPANEEVGLLDGMLSEPDTSLEPTFVDIVEELPENPSDGLVLSALATDLRSDTHVCVPTDMLILDEPANPAPDNDSNAAATTTDVSWTGRIRKRRVIDLKHCKCGDHVTAGEMEAGNNVLKCRIEHCDTVW